METHCQHARLIWNVALEQHNMHQPVFGKRLSFVDQSKELTKARSEVDWLGEGSSWIQQAAIRDLEQAFKNWWKNPSHFGRPTRRKRGVNESFYVQRSTVKKLNRKWGTVNIPKCGYVKFRLSRQFHDVEVCKTARIKKDRAGRWHVSFLALQPEFLRTATGLEVGVDLGVTQTITLSTGEHLKMPDLLSLNERKRRLRLQRKMAKQKKGSNRRNCTRHKLAVITNRETDRRKDWVEKTTTQLVRDYDFIAIEDLDIKKMTEKAPRKKNLNKGIQSASWGAVRIRIENKANAAISPCIVARVNPAYTSQRCNKCDHVDKKNRENQAVFYCRKCGHTENADVNASKNILAAGIVVSGRGDSELGSVKRQTTSGVCDVGVQ